MPRMKLLTTMAAMVVLMVLAVYAGSPYAPVVQTSPADIEDVWAIEDTRSESEMPLVTALENNGVPLAYDAQENTFYCTLGMENTETWPRLHLHAPGANGVSLMFVDDYQYDFCDEAIREGYPYQVMAYTDTEFAYFDIVFTGMMQIHMSIASELTKEDLPGSVNVLNSERSIGSYARMHVRGAGTTEFPKNGIRIEFTRNGDGTQKINCDVPGIGMTENLVLLPMYSDNTFMRDKLCWTMYADMTEENEVFGPRKMQYAELFVNDSYEGIYLMMEPYDNEKELGRYSPSSIATDSVYRVSRLHYGTERPTLPGVYVQEREFELYYMPAGAKQFADLQAYIDTNTQEDDEIFAAMAEKCMDVESTIRYMLLLQSAGLTDNAFNNLNIWARHENGGVRYQYFPWDLDNSFALYPTHVGSEYDKWLYLPAADRMLNMDVGGMRTKLYEKWKALRADVWNLENLEARVNSYAAELNDSGAVARNAQRWNHELYMVDGYGIVSFLMTRFTVLDTVFEKIAQYEGRIDWLDYTDYENRSCSMVDWL